MKHLKPILFTVVTFLIIFLAFVSKNQEVTKTDFLLDTYVSITAYGKNADEGIKKALYRTRELENLLSAYIPESDVSKINSAKTGVMTRVSDDCFNLISRAVELSSLTDGDFDITIKPVMDLWGFGKDVRRVPQNTEIKDALDKVDYKSILLDYENKSVALLKEGMAIDLGGIAKGYCADEAAYILKENGVKSACIDFGGNVVTIGDKPLGFFDRIRYGKSARPFSIGIQNPEAQRGEILETVLAEEDTFAVVTSGGYERFFEENGNTYHHIIDTKTGFQPENNILSVTVIGKNSTDCDAFSTALFVSGEIGADRLYGRFSEIIFVYDTGEVKKIYPRGEK